MNEKPAVVEQAEVTTHSVSCLGLSLSRSCGAVGRIGTAPGSHALAFSRPNTFSDFDPTVMYVESFLNVFNLSSSLCSLPAAGRTKLG